MRRIGTNPKPDKDLRNMLIIMTGTVTQKNIVLFLFPHQQSVCQATQSKKCCVQETRFIIITFWVLQETNFFETGKVINDETKIGLTLSNGDYLSEDISVKKLINTVR